jgi:hypothetical protein
MREYLTRGKVVFVLIALNALLCVSAMGQENEILFGSAGSDSTFLKGDIYRVPFNTSLLPNFSNMTPIGNYSISTKVLDIPRQPMSVGFFGIPKGFVLEWFAIKFTGSFNAKTSGDYGFRLVSDDGSKLLIDGKKIIDNDGKHSEKSVSGNVTLTRGQHSIEVDYFQGPKYELALQLFWTPPKS